MTNGHLHYLNINKNNNNDSHNSNNGRAFMIASRPCLLNCSNKIISYSHVVICRSVLMINSFSITFYFSKSSSNMKDRHFHISRYCLSIWWLYVCMYGRLLLPWMEPKLFCGFWFFWRSLRPLLEMKLYDGGKKLLKSGI